MKYIKIFENFGKVILNFEDSNSGYFSKAELVPISELIKFREFDRRVNFKWDKKYSTSAIEQAKSEFLQNGITDILIINYSQSDKKVLLVEGNHRLVAAMELGLKYLPARVYRTLFLSDNKNAMSVSGYPEDEYGYVPGDLKPSQVGIPGCKPITESLY